MEAVGPGLNRPDLADGALPRRVATLSASLRRRLTGIDETTPPPDADLIARVKRGDGAAFGALYDRHVEVVYRYVRTRVIDTALAEDITHDVFVAALEALPRLRWEGDLRPWLLRIAHNRIANHWRRSGRRPEPDDLANVDDDASAHVDHDVTGDPVARAETSLRRDALWAALGSLSDLEREVIALRFGQEWSVTEIARRLGRSEHAVCSIQYRAVRRLTGQLCEKEDGR